MFSWLTRWWWRQDDEEGDEDGDEGDDEVHLAAKIGLFYIQLFQRLLIPAHVRDSKYMSHNPYHRIFYNPNSSPPVKRV